jgi:L-2-hydroxyglutarate oxidase LhgO
VTGPGSPHALEVEIAVVGAGVVGLAVAAALAPSHAVVVLERHDSYGRETTSHNSGVVHSGIYYPSGSLKHRLCLAGNSALYAWCVARHVPARRTGKLIVALDGDAPDALEALLERAQENSVDGVRLLTVAEARALEPAVPATAALLIEQSGIVDQLAFTRSLEAAAREHGALLAYRHTVVAAEPIAGGFRLELRDPDGAALTLHTAALVNCAGHAAPSLAAALGYPLDGDPTTPTLRQHPNRGRYYDIVTPALGRTVTRLVYPLPRPALEGLGVHLTIDVDGGLHLGPDTEWLAADALIDYRNDDARRAEFLAAGQRLLPQLRDEDIAPGQVGYRPKRSGPGEPEADFLLWHDRGYVHLGGIESPGLTAALPIAAEVASMLRR